MEADAMQAFGITCRSTAPRALLTSADAGQGIIGI